MEVVVTGAGAVVARGAETHLPGALGLDADGSVPLGHLPEVVRGRASRAERVTQLLLAAGGRALATAGFDAAAAAETRAGIVVGTAFGCFLTNAAYQRRVAAGGQPAASPRLFAATVSNAAAGELAIAYRLGGPAVTLTAGGASGLTALVKAMEAIRAGRADIVVAAGVDATGDALAGWLAATGGAYGAPPAEAGEGLAAAIAAACADAGLAPAEIALVVSAAPPPLASLEARALAAVLGERRRRLLIPKRVFGETFGAAGILGVLAAGAEAGRG